MLLYQESKTINCKYCGMNGVVKCGSYNGVPRYLCKSCGRKFKNDNHAFHMSVPVEYIGRVLNLHYSGMRINDIRNDIRINYGYYPSAALIHLWIEKYTDIASRMINSYHPKVGDTWIAGEMVTRLGRQKYWVYEIIDDKTLYILASLIASRSSEIVEALIEVASEVAGRHPEIVLVYTPLANFNTLKKGSGYVTDHVPMEEYAIRHRIGILGGLNKYRIRNLNFLRTLKTANKFYNGLSINYNYFSPTENSNGKTPAELAQINYPYRSWKDLVEQSNGHCTG